MTTAFYDRLALLAGRRKQSAHADRIVSELSFAARLSAVENDCFAPLLEEAAELLSGEEWISPALAEKAEGILMPIAPAAKAYRVHLVAHAHIDMNWMWGYQETAAATADTFRTMLDLMERYPEFRFSQSQASTYEIVEKYLPEMLPEIAARVKEGRWEVTASTWVENDENMPCGESLVRQQLYTKRYLSSLLGIDGAALNLDFQPDTFGHNAAIPDICAAGGVKYFYHCRGNDGSESCYRWKGRSGAELLCYCDPYWYSGSIEPSLFERVPGVCAKYGIHTYLTVYGVGDHGGGPSARDIRRILEIREWPIMPTLLFSSYGDFFGELEREKEKLPVREGECNFIFSGCYTSHIETKKQNRIAENALRQSEFLNSAAATLAGGNTHAKQYEDAWREILFSQFHDILPGSGMKPTTEYASAGYQNAMAAARCLGNEAARKLAASIDLRPYLVPGDAEEAAGVGSGADMDGIDLSLPGQPGGKRRAFHLFNPVGTPFDGAYALTIWNREGATEPAFFDLAGNRLESSRKSGRSGYWCGESEEFLIRVKIPAFGYTTILMDATDRVALPGIGTFANRKIEYPGTEIVLENDLLRVVFERKTMEILSFTEKKSGKNLLGKGAGAFRFALENAAAGMTSWKEGEPLREEILNESQVVFPTGASISPLRQGLSYRLEFGNGSKLEVEAYLLQGDPVLHYTVNLHFAEIGDGRFTPRVDALFPTAERPVCYRYDIPFGTVDRPALPHDVPALNLAASVVADGCAPVLLSGAGYGFKGDGNALSLCLLRASHDPDPLPEYGDHEVRFGIGFAENAETGRLLRLAERFANKPICCPARNGKTEPTLPPEGALLELEGENVAVTWIKPIEGSERKGLVLRLCRVSDDPAAYTLRPQFQVSEVYAADLTEKPIAALPFCGGCLRGTICKGDILTLLLYSE